jgi:hypothetical protein
MISKSISEDKLVLATPSQELTGFDRKSGQGWSLPTSLDISYMESMRELYCEIPSEA